MYLLSAASPWGGDNKQLLTLYRNTNAQGECHLLLMKQLRLVEIVVLDAGPVLSSQKTRRWRGLLTTARLDVTTT